MSIVSPEHTCCFSGYRPEKMPLPGAMGTAIPDALYEPLLAALREACAAGYTQFITGMSRGFDLWAAQAVIILRREQPISLLCAVPYAGQEARWEPDWIEVHRAVRGRADGISLLSPGYVPDCFHRRNRFMVDASSRLICYYDGQSGGTGYTVRYAEKRGCALVNLAENQLILSDFSAPALGAQTETERSGQAL